MCFRTKVYTEKKNRFHLPPPTLSARRDRFYRGRATVRGTDESVSSRNVIVTQRITRQISSNEFVRSTVKRFQTPSRRSSSLLPGFRENSANPLFAQSRTLCTHNCDTTEAFDGHIKGRRNSKGQKRRMGNTSLVLVDTIREALLTSYRRSTLRTNTGSGGLRDE